MNIMRVFLSTIYILTLFLFGFQFVVDAQVYMASDKIEMVFVEGSKNKKIHSFYISKYEITQKQWEDVMGYNPSSSKGENLPVENQDSCELFIERLNKKIGLKYRLPTEKEREYVASGGNRKDNSISRLGGLGGLILVLDIGEEDMTEYEKKWDFTPITGIFGLSVGSGYQDGATRSFYNSIGFDFAVGLHKTYYGGFLSYKSVNSFSFGPQFMLGKKTVSDDSNRLILGAGLNMRFDRNLSLLDACTNTLRHEDFGVDGLLRLGVKIEGGAYMFADFCLGKVTGSDYCENTTQTIEWNKLRASASLNLGIHLNSGGFKVSDHYNYPKYSLNGWWSAIWFRLYGYGVLANKSADLHDYYGFGLDLFAFKIKVIEFSVLNCEYDAYSRTFDYMPRLRVIQPVSKLSAVYIETGVKLYDGVYEFLSLFFHRMDKGIAHKVVNSFVLQVGVNVGGWCEVFLRGSSGLGVGEMPQGTFALHAGLAFSFATGF